MLINWKKMCVTQFSFLIWETGQSQVNWMATLLICNSFTGETPSFSMDVKDTHLKSNLQKHNVDGEKKKKKKPGFQRTSSYAWASLVKSTKLSNAKWAPLWRIKRQWTSNNNLSTLRTFVKKIKYLWCVCFSRQCNFNIW